eukprot:TRINITY_DN17733_c0_g1_i1.p1 TRINITY_DN17733_c0_g1~~TRINITY_DN17733_c0_g1_i1.p1  ORF type:complete len:204 (+),score=51.61 TRINITY_DN17733_c0_g1_i1:55-666(+)
MEAAGSLKEILGDYSSFISTLRPRLAEKGIDVSKYEMDHLCYRCTSREHYQSVMAALVPRFGQTLIESMIGGRPIATIKLAEVIEADGFKVQVVEIPCPKAGTSYTAGLEHAEYVVGTPEDGCEATTRLRAFMKECPADIVFDESALSKELNADVGLPLGDYEGRPIRVKFHQRPLEEVVAFELQHGHIDQVPADYFKTTADA